MLEEKLYLKKKLVMQRRNKLHYQMPDAKDMGQMLGRAGGKSVMNLIML